MDSQDGNLVASCVCGQQIASITRGLQGTLGSEVCSSPYSSGGERGAGDWCQTAVGMTVEPGDRVGTCRVVVHIDVANHVLLACQGYVPTCKAHKCKGRR